MKKVKGHFWPPSNPSTRQMIHFEAKKGLSKRHVLKSNIPLLTRNSINGKSLNWTPTGYATHLPSGDKTF